MFNGFESRSLELTINHPPTPSSTLHFEDYMFSTHLWQFASTGHTEELKDVVHTAGVGHAFFNDGVELLELVTVLLAGHDALASAHQVLVPSQGVDLTIVSQQPEDRQGGILNPSELLSGSMILLNFTLKLRMIFQNI